MSQWTHVAGLIRIDSLEQLVLFDTTSELEEILKDPPGGSEGPIQTQVVCTRPDYGPGVVPMSWGHVAIWGDLRDFGEDSEKALDQISRWLQDVLQACTDSRKMVVRDAVVSVDIESKAYWVLKPVVHNGHWDISGIQIFEPKDYDISFENISPN